MESDHGLRFPLQPDTAHDQTVRHYATTEPGHSDCESKSDDFMEMIDHLRVCERFPDKIHEFWCPECITSDHAQRPTPLKIPCMEKCRCFEKKSFTGKAVKVIRRACSINSSKSTPNSPVSYVSSDMATTRSVFGDAYYPDTVIRPRSCEPRAIDPPREHPKQPGAPEYPKQQGLATAITTSPCTYVGSELDAKQTRAELPDSQVAEMYGDPIEVSPVHEMGFDSSSATIIGAWNSLQSPSGLSEVGAWSTDPLVGSTHTSYGFPLVLENQQEWGSAPAAQFLSDQPLVEDPLEMDVYSPIHLPNSSQILPWTFGHDKDVLSHFDTANGSLPGRPIIPQGVLQPQNSNTEEDSKTRHSSFSSMSTLAGSIFDRDAIQPTSSRTTSLDSNEFPPQLQHNSRTEIAQIQATSPIAHDSQSEFHRTGEGTLRPLVHIAYRG
ncbi:uncharacterized protein E0L32_000468 [Thyridium curvatum]|uniref:Uncharacterized protein n=1 Tax=Thyridium curvatum TaxID=1093900 RepID=A0A507B5T2_9PEZI|nr:uncharacterized protein E0L32_000468 [Thyridium curvatum]TPX14074.1 hypothetical protein E0L32_000468 [Thyridium curvatum]